MYLHAFLQGSLSLPSFSVSFLLRIDVCLHDRDIQDRSAIDRFLVDSPHATSTFHTHTQRYLVSLSSSLSIYLVLLYLFFSLFVCLASNNRGKSGRRFDSSGFSVSRGWREMAESILLGGSAANSERRLLLRKPHSALERALLHFERRGTMDSSQKKKKKKETKRSPSLSDVTLRSVSSSSCRSSFSLFHWQASLVLLSFTRGYLGQML